MNVKDLPGTLLKLSFSLLAVAVVVYITYMIAVARLAPTGTFPVGQEVKQIVQSTPGKPWVEITYSLTPMNGQFNYRYQLTNKSDRDIIISWPLIDQLIGAKGYGPVLHVVKKGGNLEFTVVSDKQPEVLNSMLLVHIAGGQKPPWRHRLSDDYWYVHARQVCSGPVPLLK
jgi:hypothetical protein